MARINHLKNNKQSIRIAHSPDSDDLFLFWAIRNQLIDLDNFEFSLECFDTHKLNQLAKSSIFDVSAISLAAFATISKDYLILPHGACFGRDFGPVLLKLKGKEISDLGSLRISIPGNTTTAALLLRIRAPRALTIEVPITELSRPYELLEAYEIDAALIIHEGQLSYDTSKFEQILDLGSWWFKNTNLALPLGVNVIKRNLGDETIARVSAVIRNSIDYAFANEDEIIGKLLEIAKSRNINNFDEKQLRKYLSMYANEDSRQMTPEHCQAIQRLLAAQQTGTISSEISNLPNAHLFCNISS